jgi:hypothetical protein
MLLSTCRIRRERSLACASSLWFSILIAIALSLAPLGATTLLPADFAQMVSESQLIVHARVVAVEGELIGTRRTIESRVTIQVLSSIKGQAASELVFRVPGGRVGRYRRIFVGAPTFNAGDEVLLFLKGRAPSLAMPYGLSQGVYRVSRAGGSPVVTPVPPLDGVAGTLRGDPVRTPLALDEFTHQVRALAGVPQ